MKSKLIATMVKAIIDLRLLVGYRLVTLDDWLKLNLQLSETQTSTKQVDELRSEVLHWQDQCHQLNLRISIVTTEKETDQTSHMAVIVQLKKDKDKLVKDFHDVSARLTETTNEIEIANSEMLILRESLEEGTELSKQLKEALDRWTS